MTLMLRHRKTGEHLELLDVTPDDYAFVAPEGHPERGRLVHREELEPDPWELVFEKGFPRWAA